MNNNFKLQWPLYNAYILYIIMYKNQGRFNKLSSAGVKHPLACDIYLPLSNRPNTTAVPGHFTIFLYLICDQSSLSGTLVPCLGSSPPPPGSPSLVRPPLYLYFILYSELTLWVTTVDCRVNIDCQSKKIP